MIYQGCTRGFSSFFAVFSTPTQNNSDFGTT